jgi:hypothetical protein
MYPNFPAICAWRERMEALPTLKRFRAAQPPRAPIEHARRWVERNSGVRSGSRDIFGALKIRNQDVDGFCFGFTVVVGPGVSTEES